MTKVCNGCKQELPASAFPRRVDRKGGTALQSRCRDCRNAARRAKYKEDDAHRERVAKQVKASYQRHRAKRIAAVRAWTKSNPDRRREWRLQSKYNLSLAEFNSLLKYQGYRCGICKTDAPGYQGWNVDHDHCTGDVRGILCGNCNKGIGLLGDNPEILRRAAVYLRSAESLIAVADLQAEEV